MIQARRFCVFVCLVSAGVFLLMDEAFAGANHARVWEDSITIRTYPWYQDVNPNFQVFTGRSAFYPYPLEDMLTDEPEDRDYHAFIVENEYLKVTVLQELGGHVHSVLDKTTGEQMFYYNHVVRPGRIGLRGAWISGGIEWNTGPTSHTVTCVAPIDVCGVEHEDGSASIVIGNVERVFRTQWAVILTLRPGKAYLEERIRIFNPRETPQPYYFWNCTAVPNTDGMRFMYPMTLGTDHNGETFYSWPVNDGKDLSWSKNYQEMSSIFAYECDQDFFGSYDYDVDRGVVAYADHYLLPGKKAWTWGRGQVGVFHQMKLTEDDGPYNEVQTGPLRTQADFGLIPPHGVVTWEEWWYPVHDLQGYVFASRELAANVLETENGARAIKLLGTGIWENATVRVTAGAGTFTQTVNLQPTEPSLVMPQDLDQTQPWDILVLGDQDELLASFTYPLPLPEVEPPELPKEGPADTPQSHYLKGVLAVKQHRPEDAQKHFMDALKINSRHIGSLYYMAMLNLESGLWNKAASFALAAIQDEEDRGDAQLVLSEAYLQLGDFDSALTHAYDALADASTRARAFAQIGRIHLKRGRIDLAIKHLIKAVEANGETLVSRNRLALALLAIGESEAAAEEACMVLKIDPLDRLAACVLAFAEPTDENLQIRDTVLRDNAQNVLEVAYAFVDLRQPEMALTVLEDAYLQRIDFDALPPADAYAKASCPRVGQPETPLEPMVLYLAAYLYDSLGNNEAAQECWQQAAAYAPDFAFPHRVESIPVLQAATRTNPNDAQPWRMLGHLLVPLGRMEEARQAWEKAVSLNPADSVSLGLLARVAWKLDNDLDHAASLFTRAVAARPDDPALYHDAARVLNERKDYAQARTLLEKAITLKYQRGDIYEDLCRRYIDDGESEQAIAVLEKTSFSNWEARHVIHDLFMEAHLNLAQKAYEAKDYKCTIEHAKLATTYPENLNVGRPTDPNEAAQYLWMGKGYLGLGKKAEAKEALTHAASFPHEGSSPNAQAACEAAELLKKGL